MSLFRKTREKAMPNRTKAEFAAVERRLGRVEKRLNALEANVQVIQRRV